MNSYVICMLLNTKYYINIYINIYKIIIQSLITTIEISNCDNDNFQLHVM